MANKKEIKTKQLGVPVEEALHSRILRCAEFCAISASAFARFAIVKECENAERRMAA